MESYDKLNYELKFLTCEDTMVTVNPFDLATVLYEHEQLTKYIETFHVLSMYYNDRLKHWMEQGEKVERRVILAFKDAAELKINPYPEGIEKIDFMAQTKWLEIKGEELTLN